MKERRVDVNVFYSLAVRRLRRESLCQMSPSVYNCHASSLSMGTLPGCALCCRRLRIYCLLLVSAKRKERDTHFIRNDPQITKVDEKKVKIRRRKCWKWISDIYEIPPMSTWPSTFSDSSTCQLLTTSNWQGLIWWWLTTAFTSCECPLKVPL